MKKLLTTLLIVSLLCSILVLNVSAAPPPLL